MIVEIERVAHGGVCVAHGPDGRVVFVRHTLPGEQVRVVVTEERKTYLRADAVEVLRPAPGRVKPPCPWSGPGRCGGCDWQHVDPAEQRRLKAAVVAEQLHRLARVDREVTVEAAPGETDGLGWRTRLRLATDSDGRAGLRRHRSHDIEPIDDCLLAVDGADVHEVVGRRWPPAAEVLVEVSATGERAVAIGAPEELLTEVAADREWGVPIGGFWQVHREAAALLVDTVLAMAEVRPTDDCLDLYAGVGLFAGALAPLVRSVTAVESDARAVAAARVNVPEATVVRDRVDRWLHRTAGVVADVVVLDPPRRGAGAAVVRDVAATGARRVVYVACDPAALARDVATFDTLGYRLGELRAFDLFPMTAHVECVAVLTASNPAS